MRLKLKENPREWQKFTAVTALLFTLVALALWRRQIVPATVFITVSALSSAGLLICLVLNIVHLPFIRMSNTIGEYGFLVGLLAIGFAQRVENIGRAS